MEFPLSASPIQEDMVLVSKACIILLPEMTHVSLGKEQAAVQSLWNGLQRKRLSGSKLKKLQNDHGRRQKP